MSLALSILPVLLTIVAGWLTAASGILPRDRWESLNTLNFRILIPVTLVHSIALSDLSDMTTGSWIGALLGTLAIAAATVLAMRPLLSTARLPNPAFTTVFQTTTRWNAFIALAAAEQFIGAKGIALLAIGMAVLIPVINIGNIVILAAFGTARTSLVSIAGSIIRNPLVIGCLIGLFINLSGLPLPDALLGTLDLIGRAALGMGLLAVGAGIVLGRLFDTSWQMWLGVLLRLGLCPLVFLAFAAGLGLGFDETLAGLLVFAVPAAVNGYIVAQKMGGDAELYADILTWQTILSLALLPIYVALAQMMF